jgi:hypothetical protein
MIVVGFFGEGGDLGENLCRALLRALCISCDQNDVEARAFGKLQRLKGAEDALFINCFDLLRHGFTSKSWNAQEQFIASSTALTQFGLNPLAAHVPLRTLVSTASLSAGQFLSARSVAA